MKKIILIAIVVAVIVLILVLTLPTFKQSKQPETTPTPTTGQMSQAEIQSRAVTSALQLYQQKKAQGMQFSSQCLGTLEEFGYVVDIVNVPRDAEDDKQENQCEDFRTGRIRHFIELDKDGNIVRVF